MDIYRTAANPYASGLNEFLPTDYLPVDRVRNGSVEKETIFDGVAAYGGDDDDVRAALHSMCLTYLPN